MAEAKYLWPWEQDAQRGLPLPDGLELYDQLAYVTMRTIYQEHKSGAISRDSAAAEKRKVYRQWAQEASGAAFDRKLTEYHTRLWTATESAVSAYMKDKTIENADRLVRVMLGLREEG